MSSSVNTEASLDNTDDEQPKQPIKTTVVLKIQQNIGIIFLLKHWKDGILDMSFVTWKLFSFHFAFFKKLDRDFPWEAQHVKDPVLSLQEGRVAAVAWVQSLA